METTAQELEPVYPPKAVFRDDGLRIEGIDPKNRAGQLLAPAYRAHYPDEGGVLVFHQGEKYPVRGFPFKEAVFMADIVKRAAVNTLKFLIALPGNVLRRRVIASAVEQFGDFAECLAERSGSYVKPQYFCTAVREVYRVATGLAGDSEGARHLVDAICHVLEFDDGYRYRVQDIFGLIDRKAVLARPARELTRVLTLAQGRGQGTAEKFGYVKRVLPFLLFIPVVRRTVRAFFEQVDLAKLKLDPCDLYKCLIWGGYDFLGASFEERLTIRELIDKPVADVEAARPLPELQPA